MWCLLAAIAMHVLAAVLILPLSLVSPLKEEQVITVELVPEPKPPEKPKTQPPPPATPPQPEKPPEASAPVEPPANASSAPQGQTAVLKPVLQFGDKDRGPRKSLAGQNTEGGAAAPLGLPDPARQGLPKVLSVTTDAADEVLQGASAKAAKTGDGAQTEPDATLHSVKTLLSPDAINDVSSMMAMGSKSRGARFSQLCITELHVQLLYGSPAYDPDLLPPLEPVEGTVLEVTGSAFRANSQWYDVSVRCEVDTQATKVVNFAFRVGKPIPRSEWASRRLPPQ
ncbi:hypothetical protein GCM10007874_30830 [Labrys miyagiensis]|uniref:DUF930 domain-containing protein n=2 Tax=Labrys miyagiensis TaxID=346912 RepID=A0ABQ6CI87_9HYPH|nr:hypothetical protein GCM10007874_30830 [Labrys miyagiensis]